MAKTIFRCDNMPGIDNRAYITSVLVQDGSGTNIAAENGAIVKIGDLVKGERDLYVATLATTTDKVEDCAVLGSPEIIYDDATKKNLDDFENEAGKPAMAYLLSQGGCFSVTKEGFVSSTPPAVKGAVKIGANGKIDAGGTGTALGTCIAIESAGGCTYYVIKL